MSESNWTSVNEKGGYDAPGRSNGEIEYSQRDKPIKAVIGIAVLVVLALAFSLMNPAARDVSHAPVTTTGETTGAAR